MMRRRPFAAAAVAGVLTIGTLGACSSDDGGGDDGPVTITLVEYQQQRVDLMSDLIPQFEEAMAAEGKEITVELIADVVTDGDFRTKLTQQLHAGTAPDVIDTGGSNISGWATAGYLLELDDYLADWDGWESYYDVPQQTALTSDGHYYSVPHEASVQSLFERADVLEELGVGTEQPQTWDELIDRLKEIKAQTGEAPIVIPAGTAWGGGSWTEGFLPIVAGTGSPLYDLDNGTWTVESDGLTASFDLFAELVQEGLLPVQDLLNPNPWEPTKYEAFPEGTIPIAAQGTWGWRYDWGPEGAAPIDGLTDKVITWNYPALVAGGEPYSISGGGFNFAVNAETEHADAAMELITWLSSGEALATQLAAIGAASPREGISDLEPYASEPTLLDAEEKVQTGVLPPTGEGEDQISQAVQNATESILGGGVSGEQAAAQFADEVREYLDPSFIAD